MTQPSALPPSIKRGWIYIFVVFLFLGVTALVLTTLYQDAPKRGEVIDKQRKKGATQVSYAVVFSKVSPVQADSIIDFIVADIGADSAKTNLIVGSVVTDPWCANIGEYKRVLRNALFNTKPLHIGKQTYILSMVTGLITKEQLPSTVYLIGALDETPDVKVETRTEQTAAALQLRHQTMSPVKMVTFLRPGNTLTHQRYINQFKNRAFPLEER